ncbi:MAG: DegT/DnrJ/EryC1/StrS family aminotransferase [bacterium]
MSASVVPLLDLKRQTRELRSELDAAVARVIDSCGFILGREVAAFEQAVGEYLGCRHAVGVASGTDAIWLALRALDIGPGDVVLTSPFTFFATASAILGTGARPVFADIDPATYNLAPESVRAVLTGEADVCKRQKIERGSVRVLLPVHLYGQPVDQPAIAELAAEFDCGVVEDAAQAIGARFGETRIGNSDQLVCFSFFPSKNLGAFGDGGLVTTNDPGLANRLRQLRAHGSTKKYHHGMLGTNSRLDALQAAILGVKLPHLESWVDARRAHAAAYDAAFSALDGVTVPFCAEGRYHCYHQYTVRVADGRRDALLAFLQEAGVGSAVYYPIPVHLQEAVSNHGYLAGDYPVSEAAAAEVISLPIFPELMVEERERVIEVVSEFLARS